MRLYFLQDERVHVKVFDWYNRERGHSSHDGQTPDEAYLAGLPKLKQTA